MISVFINKITEVVHIFDGLENRKSFEYKDLSFLNGISEFQLFYISNNEIQPEAFADKCKSDWLDRFEKSINVNGVLYLWFMTNDLCFVPLKNVAEAKNSYQQKQDTHIFVGGNPDESVQQYNYLDFYRCLIQLYTTEREKNESSELNQNLMEIKDSLGKITDKVDSLIESRKEEIEDNADISALKEELSKYRNDFYFKSVQRQGLDAMIEVWESMYTLLYNSRTKGSDVIETIEYNINLIERALQKTFKIRFDSSAEGDMYNEEKMIAYPSDSIFTSDEQLRGRIAKSLSPAVYWTLPRVNSSDMEFLYKEECVILYM